eukprot:gene8933-18474_t
MISVIAGLLYKDLIKKIVFRIIKIIFPDEKSYRIESERKIRSGPNIIEISLCDVQSAIEAVNGHANSIELCNNLSDGGITPSIGLVMACCRILSPSVTIHVLIRPRAGDFNYNENEFEVMLSDIKAAKDAGAHGIVTGILTHNNKIDMKRMQIIKSLSKGMKLTFHRAFDIIPDPYIALEDIISLGCDRLLTSGQSFNAVQGISILKELQNQANDRIVIIAAAGVNIDNVQHIIHNTNIKGIHAATSVLIQQHSSQPQEILQTPTNNMQIHADTTLTRISNEDIATTTTSTTTESTPKNDFIVKARMGSASTSSTSADNDTNSWLGVSRDKVSQLVDTAVNAWNTISPSEFQSSS